MISFLNLWRVMFFVSKIILVNTTLLLMKTFQYCSKLCFRYLNWYLMLLLFIFITSFILVFISILNYLFMLLYPLEDFYWYVQFSNLCLYHCSSYTCISYIGMLVVFCNNFVCYLDHLWGR